MKSQSAKAAWRETIVDSLDRAGALYIARYSGLTVEDLTDLRVELKKVDADFHVVKNTIAKKAIEGRDESVIGEMLKGQTGIVYAFGDVAAAAKTVVEGAKKHEKFELVGGFMEKAALDEKAVKQIASLPSRDVLIAKIVGSFVAPHRGLVGVLSAVPRSVVSVLNQIKETKSA